MIRLEDDLNEAAYGKSARELLGEGTQMAEQRATGLPAFPNAVTRFTTTTSSDHESLSKSQ